MIAPASDPTAAAVSFIGVVVELGGASMLVALFSLLRRYVLRRPYFTAWTGAWVAIAVAIVSLTIRYDLMPGLVQTMSSERSPLNRGLYFVYQSSKLLAYYAFVAGTRMYVAGSRRTVRIRLEWLIAPAVALVSVLVSPRGLNQVVIWQAPIAAMAFGYCAFALFQLPRSRRTLGTVATATGFGLLGALWVVYAVSFPLVLRPGGVSGVAGATVRYNAYLDLLLNVFLGYGMVVMLMEDAKREADDARAELRVAHDRMRRAALYDSLTESLNRRAFVEGVGLDMARATFGTVVLADVDDLKSVNDGYGHVAGDRVLRHCAEALRAALRPYDKLYRWGGDEFLVIVPSARATDVQQRLMNVLARAEPVDVGGGKVQVHVSVGSADYASAEELEQAIELADRAMYQEKSGRKRRNSTPVAQLPASVELPPGAGLAPPGRPVRS